MEIIACLPVERCQWHTNFYPHPDTSPIQPVSLLDVVIEALSCKLHLFIAIRMSSVSERHEPLWRRPRMGNNTVRLPPKVWRTSCPTEPGNGCLWTRGTTEIIASCICNIGSLIESANAQYWQTVNSVRKYRCLGCSEIMDG